MLRRAAFALLVCLPLAGVPGCTIWKEPKIATWKNTTSVEVMERLLWKEMEAGNWVEVESRLASNFQYTTQEGVYDKAQALERLKDLAAGYDFALGEFTVTDHGETTVLTYRAVLTFNRKRAVPGERPKPESHRRLAVWQKQKEGWVMVALADMRLEHHLNLPMSENVTNSYIHLLGR